MNWMRLCCLGLGFAILFGSAVGSDDKPSSAIVIEKVGDVGGIHNVFQLGSRVLSGSGPSTADDFRALKERGVSIIVSVDGTPPAVALAREAGMKYVHVPLSYDSISREEQLALARVLQEYPKEKIFFHCQHGKHRGPAAAATACQINKLMTAADVRSYLKVAGTSPDYIGLWTAAADSPPKKDDEELPELHESVEPPEIVVMMKEIEDQFAKSKAAAAKTPTSHDAFRQSNALLTQLFKESARLPSASEIADELSATAAEVTKLNAESPANVADATAIMAKIEQRCVKCHATHRND
ncbi:MAG: hypothetical protein JNL58_19425 [Planctomyces sp.]|nr:hypothetical protein [Planctomyces sp.]